jgi:hypothetical protein
VALLYGMDYGGTAPGVAFVVLDPCTMLPLIILIHRQQLQNLFSWAARVTLCFSLCELFIAGFRAVNYLQ